jgi:uncharacterized protein YijF (DUF1287 family)
LPDSLPERSRSTEFPYFTEQVDPSMMLRLVTLLCVSWYATPAVAAPADDLVAAARAQIGVTVRYDGSYQRLAYPSGDVPIDRGVCTDVVIRAYRHLGIDLQELVHKDMRTAWRAYPHPLKWGLKSTDTNIDHRRVPNLDAFFRRHGTVLATSPQSAAFRPGDIVVWQLPIGLPHIGIVADRVSPTGTPLVIHNIASGTKMDDVLFAFTITGHYRYLPPLH